MRSNGVVRSWQYQKITKPLPNISVCRSTQPDELIPWLYLLLFILVHNKYLDILMFELLFANNVFIIFDLVRAVVLVDNYEVFEKWTLLLNFL